MPAPTPASSIRGLHKTYDNGLTALHPLDLDVAPGSFVGLLGPNGAGKSTLIGSVTNLVIPTGGRIAIFGHDHGTREARSLVGLAEQDAARGRALPAHLAQRRARSDEHAVVDVVVVRLRDRPRSGSR